MSVYEKDRRRNKVLFWNLQGRYAILYNILLKLIYEVITMEPIYVTGHKSPDTDSICSSFGMARLKQLQAEGRLLTAGPNPAIDDENPGEAGFTGSTVIAQFESLSAAKEWAAQDPYVEAGVYGDVIVKPFKKVF